MQDDRAFLLIGTGINVEPVAATTRVRTPSSISEASPRALHAASTTRPLAFIEHLDEQLSQPFDRDAVLEQWRALSIHQPGDRIHCVLGDRTVDGTWAASTSTAARC